MIRGPGFERFETVLHDGVWRMPWPRPRLQRDPETKQKGGMRLLSRFFGIRYVPLRNGRQRDCSKAPIARSKPATKKDFTCGPVANQAIDPTTSNDGVQQHLQHPQQAGHRPERWRSQPRRLLMLLGKILGHLCASIATIICSSSTCARAAYPRYSLLMRVVFFALRGPLVRIAFSQHQPADPAAGLVSAARPIAGGLLLVGLLLLLRAC